MMVPGDLQQPVSPASPASAQRPPLLNEPLVSSLLDATFDLAAILDGDRRLVAANRKLLDFLGVRSEAEVLGLRLGDALGCLSARSAPRGCGTHENCSMCAAVRSMIGCLETHETTSAECRLRTASTFDGGALDLAVQASSLPVPGSDLIIVSLRDISHEKRRRVLERTFFHDVLNDLTAARSCIEIVRRQPETAPATECLQTLLGLLEHVHDEIRGQRALLAAERGELEVAPRSLVLSELVDDVVAFQQQGEYARGRRLVATVSGDLALETDPVLLRRVLGNLLRNALEASSAGQTVELRAEPEGEEMVFRVWNAAVMSPEVRAQVFLRSFSTKPGPGRGVGTHSVKLLTERYLGGRVSFRSEEREGTTFEVRLPLRLPAAG